MRCLFTRSIDSPTRDWKSTLLGVLDAWCEGKESDDFKPKLEALRAHLTAMDARAFPAFTKVSDPARHPSFVHIIRQGNGEHFNVAIEVRLPCCCTSSALVWLPWLPHQEQPETPANGYYRPISFGTASPGTLVMPRRTTCYGHAYAYSGQTHPVEPVTPPAVEALYAETCSIFGLEPEKGPNMCLANHYRNGRELISEHSDNENQFGELHDVYCWCTGATRPGVFRHSAKTIVGRELKTKGKRELFTVLIPAGLYVMRGRCFQSRFTHEFSQVQEAFFKRTVVPAPVEGTLEKAIWMSTHEEEVREGIRKRGRDDDAFEMSCFDEWKEPRTSFTLRHFKKPQ
jgi:hypothetical protein